MEQVEKRWQVSPRITPEAENNLSEYSPVLQQLLFNRGISTAADAQEFLAAELPGHDLYQLRGMTEAIERIGTAIENDEQIVIYGDYDTDGVTASALMVQTLTALGARVDAYIPDRFEEGYGLNKDALSSLKADGADLVITVDCGIRALEEAEHARKIGLDLVITDHHTPGPEIPDALAVVNPKQDGDNYPEKNLAGVGTAFKVASALLDKYDANGLQHEHLLDLVAIGTVADMVPLVGENRALVKQGLRYLRRPHRQGLYSLMQIAGVKPPAVMSSHIGFTIGPRLNAAGRLASALEAYELLMVTDQMEGGRLAQELENTNRERQRVTREMQKRAEELALAADPDSYLIFAADERFNMGVVGLAASRLVDQYYRPTIVAHRGAEETRGSCRSIPEFHITHALEECADLLTHFGGHAAAAGFTVSNEHVDEFVTRMKRIARDQLAGEDLTPVLHADAEVQLKDLDNKLIEDLDRLQPTGYGNREAVFVTHGLAVKRSRTVGSDDNHLKMTVSDGFIHMDAIAFRQGHWHGEMPGKIDLLYNFEINEFRGQRNFQLNVRDIKLAE